MTIVASYGCVTIVARELEPVFQEVKLESSMGRKLILATLRGNSVAVGNVHLESLDNQSVRAVQLRQCEQAMAGFETCFLVGKEPIDTDTFRGLIVSTQVTLTLMRLRRGGIGSNRVAVIPAERAGRVNRTTQSSRIMFWRGSCQGGWMCGLC